MQIGDLKAELVFQRLADVVRELGVVLHVEQHEARLLEQVASPSVK